MSKVRYILCPYCGHLQEKADRCDQCNGFFDPLSRLATQVDMGPWFVRSAQAPFQPGCSYETIRRMVRAGRIGKNTVMRGPTTRQFWSIARHVPGVSHLFGECHACGARVRETDDRCPACFSRFDFEPGRDELGLAFPDPASARRAQRKIVKAREAQRTRQGGRPAATDGLDVESVPDPSADSDFDADLEDALDADLKESLDVEEVEATERRRETETAADRAGGTGLDASRRSSALAPGAGDEPTPSGKAGSPQAPFDHGAEVRPASSHPLSRPGGAGRPDAGPGSRTRARSPGLTALSEEEARDVRSHAAPRLGGGASGKVNWTPWLAASNVAALILLTLALTALFGGARREPTLMPEAPASIRQRGLASPKIDPAEVEPPPPPQVPPARLWLRPGDATPPDVIAQAMEQARVLERDGEAERALRLLERIAATNPNASVSQEFQWMLRRLRARHAEQVTASFFERTG